MDEFATWGDARPRPVSPHVPDLGFPKGQLLFIAKVQGHILSVVHQSLPGAPKASGRPHLRCWRGPSPEAVTRGLLHSPAQVGSSPGPGCRTPSFPPLPPSSESSRRLLPSFRSQHPRGPTCFILPRAHLEPRPQAPVPPLTAVGLGCQAGPWWREGRSLSPAVQPRSRSPVGAGRAGPRAQSQAGEVGSAALDRAGLSRSLGPGAHWGPSLREKEQMLRSREIPGVDRTQGRTWGP